MKLVPTTATLPHPAGGSDSRRSKGGGSAFFDTLTARLIEEEEGGGSGPEEGRSGLAVAKDPLQIILRIERLLDAFDDYRCKLADNGSPVAVLHDYARAMQTECNCLKASLPPAAASEVLDKILTDTSQSIAGEMSRLSRGEYSLWVPPAAEGER